ncbi:MAG: flagellar basal body-associated FliL family protein [Proteobacteria bacterium]|nr:flagellar basal body-associated FliL family protein [Pseudomonadota bacterium]
MADRTKNQDPNVEDDGQGADGEAPVGARRLPGKKLVLFIALPILLIGLAGAGVYFSGLADSLIGVEENEGELLSQEEEYGPSVYYEIPDMLVNLNSTGRKTGYLKISVSVEVGSDADAEQLKTALPRIVDSFQVYLRELRIEDLSGSAGLQRLREELLMRVSNAVAPTVVRDILFRELLIQ